MTTLTPAATMKRKRKRKLYRATMWGAFIGGRIVKYTAFHTAAIFNDRHTAKSFFGDVRPIEVREIKRRSKR